MKYLKDKMMVVRVYGYKRKEHYVMNGTIQSRNKTINDQLHFPILHSEKKIKVPISK